MSDKELGRCPRKGCGGVVRVVWSAWEYEAGCGKCWTPWSAERTPAETARAYRQSYGTRYQRAKHAVARALIAIAERLQG